MAHWCNAIRRHDSIDLSHCKPCKHKGLVLAVLERLRRFGHTVAMGVVILQFSDSHGHVSEGPIRFITVRLSVNGQGCGAARRRSVPFDRNGSIFPATNAI